jgi:hypothetical protein
VLCFLFALAIPNRALANTSLFLNTNVSSCGVKGLCTASSMFGLLAGPGDTLILNGNTILNDVAMGNNATFNGSVGTNNIGNATHPDVIDFSNSMTNSSVPCTGSACTGPAGHATFQNANGSTKTEVFGGTKYNPDVVTAAYQQFQDLSAYWTSAARNPVALPVTGSNNAVKGNWNIEKTGTGVHVYDTSTYSPTQNVVIGCGTSGSNNVNLACNPNDMIVIVVGSSSSILHNITFAANSGLTDDQIVFIVEGTGTALTIGNNFTVQGDFLVDNGGAYTVGTNTKIDGRIFAGVTGKGSGSQSLTWGVGAQLSDEPVMTPEPATLAMMAGGLGALIWWRRRRARA